MYAKCFFQRLWLLPLDWDTPIPAPLQNEWLDFKRSLELLSGFSIPRHIFGSGVVQIHGFCDASQHGYAMVLYLRSMQDGEVNVNIIASKTRVAPLKPISIPRLELLGAHLLSKCCHHYVNLLSPDLCLDGVFLWTDSSIVLDWINIEPHRLKLFVANRVSVIRDLTESFHWRHVPGPLNPADLASRGVSDISSLGSLWTSGPSFLKDEPNSWPILTRSSPSTSQDLELKASYNFGPPVVLNASESAVDSFPMASTWSKTVRLASIVSKWICQVKHPNLSPLGVRSYAINLLVRHIQRSSFAEDLKLIRLGKCPRPVIQKLAPFLDDDGILRVKGRLSNASLASRPPPILLPQSHRLVELLISHYHVWLGHAGPSQVQFQLTWSYWILSARRVIRKVIHRCVRCFRIAPQPTFPLMGDLPEVRVNPSPPFWCSGMDFCGPFLVKPYSLRKAPLVKCYLCIFICMATKAVHLEVAHDLSADSFIDVLKRFIARRGIPSRLFSDCGTNFLGSRTVLQKELRRLLSQYPDSDAIKDFALANQIEFSTIPPSAPHHGGLWERAVRSAKFHLKRVVGANVLTLSQLITLTTQIEAILNSRPLTIISADPGDYSVLTPAHFLIGRPLTSFPEEDLTLQLDGSLRHYQLIRAMVQRFWKQWRFEYLTTLQVRSKWIKKTSNLAVDDVVVVAEPNSPPLMWPLGRVTKVFPGKDDVVRRVQVLTRTGIYDRPSVKVFRLPLQDL